MDRLAIRLLVPALLVAATGMAAGREAGGGTPDPVAAMHDYLGRDMLFADSPGIAGYLGSIVARLLAAQPAAPPAPQILIRSTSEFSVFTDTRGHIVVGTEVLRQVESEDELAAALSHELAHVIHADAQQKDVMQDIPFTVEAAGLIAASIEDRKAGAGGVASSSSFSRDSLNRTQAVGTVWADLVAPSWNRQQERAADLAGADMLRAASYDTAAFGTLFSKIQAANAVRSDRVEAVRQTALARVKAVQPAAGNQANQLLGSLRAGAQTYAVETAFASLATFGTDYDTPQQRADAVLAHLARGTGPRRDKTARSPRFRQILRDGPAGRMLEADRAGLEVMAALAGGKPAAATPASQRLVQDLAGGEPSSPHLNLALGSWHDSEGHADLAEQRAAAWIDTELATRSAYLWRASYQVQRQEHAAALATLDLGASRLGARSLFLPDMVTVTRQKGDLPRAEQLTLECARDDLHPTLGLATQLAQNQVGKGGLYADCVAALGYDPVAKADKQAKEASGLLRQGVGAGRGLLDGLKKELGK